MTTRAPRTAWYTAAGRAGTTLIELIVVLAILGILLGVSVVAIGHTVDEPADPTVAIAEAVTEARRIAARGGQRVRLYLLADGRYQVVSPDGGTVLGSGALAVEAVDPSPFSTTIFPSGTSSGGRFRVRWRGVWQAFQLDPVTARARAVGAI